MKIGLYDINKSSYGKMRYEFPEIDLMKVYSYYKRNKKNIIELCQDYKKYKDYDLFYCFNNRRHIVSKELLKLQQEENVFLIGTCFYGDIWIPMDDEIEKCEPDVNSYAAFLRETIINESLTTWTANLFTDYYYLRYFYPEWHWNLNSSKIKDKKVILYDFDVTSNEGWQDLFLKILKDSGKRFVCRHEVVIRTIEDLKFCAENEIYRTSTKYPTKFILDIPEMFNNFKEFCDTYIEILKKFPMNSLFIYINHYEEEKSELDYFIKVVDICMYFLNSGREIYPIYDYSKIPHEYDSNYRRVEYYFTMRKPGTIYDILQERRKCDELFEEIKNKYPIFYNKIQNITRDQVKKKQKVWNYGER